MSFDPHNIPFNPANGQFVNRTYRRPELPPLTKSLTERPAGPRVLAVAQREQWVDGVARPVGEPFTIDVTEIIEDTAPDELSEIGDRNIEVTDELFRDAVARRLTPAWDGPVSLTVEKSIDDYVALTVVDDSVREFLAGSAASLNGDQARSIAALAAHMKTLPDVAVHDSDSIDLIFQRPVPYGEDTTRLRIDAAGVVTGAGSGEDWEDNDPDNATFDELTQLGLTDASDV